MKRIDSVRSMPSSLSSLAGNLAEVPRNSKCKEY